MESLLKIITKAFILLHFITQVLSLTCNFNYFNQAWQDEWSLVLTLNGKNQYRLLRKPKYENIVIVCNNYHRPITISCNKYQRLAQALPLKYNCQERESLQPVLIKTKVKYCPYTLYKIGFDIKIGGATQFYETYRVCFDREHMRPLFTINKAYPMGGGRPKFLQFNPDKIFNGRLFSAFSRSASFQRFKDLLGNNQQYMRESNLDHIIDRGHLTPSADFTLTNLKRSTFNMINVIPQFKTINVGNWLLIEKWTTDGVQTHSNVCTGVLDCDLNAAKVAKLDCVVQLKDSRGKSVPMFLADNRKIPIPLWTYKIVKKPQTALVFLTLNNIYHKGDVPVPQNICQEINCPIYLSPAVKDGRTFCCDYHHFIATNVPYLKEV